MKKRKIFLFMLALFAILYSGTFVLIDAFSSNEEIVITASQSENKQIQQRLKELGYYTGNIDGIIGSQSLRAIKNFQRDYGLTVDGIVGTKTLSALGLSPSSSYTSQDLYLLAKCVHAEARGEPYVGQVAVAAVILNRVDSPEFPNTISGVIYHCSITQSCFVVRQGRIFEFHAK